MTLEPHQLLGIEMRGRACRDVRRLRDDIELLLEHIEAQDNEIYTLREEISRLKG
jgi:hypothetical protein